MPSSTARDGRSRIHVRSSATGVGGRNRVTGLALILISACSFGGSGTAAKPLIEAGLTPLDVVWLRTVGSALILLPVLISHRDLPRRRPGLVLGFGLFAVAGCQGLYFASLALIPVGIAILIEYLGPPLLLGYLRFVRRRRVGHRAAIGALLAMIGLACVVEVWSGLGGLDPWGVTLALGAAFCQVAYFVLAEGVGGGGRSAAGPDGGAAEEPVDAIALSAYGLLVGAIVFTPLARPWTTDWAVFGHDVAMGGRQVSPLLLLGWMVLIATVLAYVTGVAAVSRLSAPVAGVVACLEAVVGTVLAWVLLGEHLALPQIIGGMLVLVGAGIAQTSAAGAGTAPGPSEITAAGPVPTGPEPLPDIAGAGTPTL